MDISVANNRHFHNMLNNTMKKKKSEIVREHQQKNFRHA